MKAPSAGDQASGVSIILESEDCAGGLLAACQGRTLGFPAAFHPKPMGDEDHQGLDLFILASGHLFPEEDSSFLS